MADLFAGTGCLGLEALSRGADRAVFLDMDSRSLDVIRRNVTRLRFEERAEVRRADAFQEVERLEEADVAFVDPPYAFYAERPDAMRELIGTLLGRVVTDSDGRVVVEHRARDEPGDVEGGMIVDQRRYGDTVVTFYSRG